MTLIHICPFSILLAVNASVISERCVLTCVLSPGFCTYLFQYLWSDVLISRRESFCFRWMVCTCLCIVPGFWSYFYICDFDDPFNGLFTFELAVHIPLIIIYMYVYLHVIQNCFTMFGTDKLPSARKRKRNRQRLFWC